MQFTLPLPVCQLIARLESAGYETYAVGGCVRDMLCGRPPHDWDLCTSALPEETKACFADCTVLTVGEKHGTVTVLWDGEPYEITTYRLDGEYGDCRRPDHVTFVRSLAEDLRRRDFTVNAMAYHPQKGLADPWGGAADLRNGILRCVGDPEKRFSEDALRILRGMRFAACYHLKIESAQRGRMRFFSLFCRRRCRNWNSVCADAAQRRKRSCRSVLHRQSARSELL